MSENVSQLAFTCSKLTLEALEQGTPCSSVSVINFEHVIAGWVVLSVKTIKATIITFNLVESGLKQV